MPNAGVYLMYLRKSRADLEKEARGEFETLAKHQRQLDDMCRARGLIVGGVFRELVSGESIAERSQFRALMEEVSAGRCAGVIVHAIDRLGRGDPMEYGWILSTFRYTGTAIITPGKDYNPGDELDFQNLQFQMFAGSWELGRIKTRLREGREQAARDGCYMSRAPYGYEKCSVDGKRTLRPSDDAPTVQRIFAMAAAGNSVAAIATKLTNEGIPSPRGTGWKPGTVRTIVANPVYAGKVRYNHVRQQVTGRDGMTFKYERHKSDDVFVVAGLHPSIVDDDVWRRANEAATPSPKLARDCTIKNPLAGLLVCKDCGRTMRLWNGMRNGEPYRRYTRKGYTPCRARSCDYSLVMKLLADGLRSIADEAEVAFQTGGASETHAAEMESVRRALAKERKKLDSLIELYTADAITLTEFMERRDASESHAGNLADRLEWLESHAPAPPEEIRAKVETALSAVLDESMPAKDRNDVLRAIIAKIEYENLTVKISEQIVNLTITLR